MLLAQRQHALLGEVISQATHLPFIGGALGLFGYDLGRRFERLPSLAARDVTIPEMAVGIYDWALLRDVATGQWQLVHWGDEAGLVRRLQWLEAQQATATEPFALQGKWQSNMSRAQYGDKFAKVQAYLAAGDCYQINLTQRFSAPYRGDEWQAYQALSQANRAPFSAFLRLPQGAILSLSPSASCCSTSAISRPSPSRAPARGWPTRSKIKPAPWSWLAPTRTDRKI